ncbi:MAG: SIS domain-containing protein [Desulfurococcales archaeon]|nr:SIS domain-containing protein [Desulfurococcales archaeon]
MNLGEYLVDEAMRIPDLVRGVSIGGVPEALLRGKGYAFGAGDSFVVAQVMQLLTSHRIVAVDPYEVQVIPPETADVCVGISVKGRTKEVVKALNALKQLGCLTVAVTHEPSSPVGVEPDAVLGIPYGGGKFPVGIGNFASAVAIVAAALGHTINASAVTSDEGVSHELKGFLGGDAVLVGTGWGRLAAEFLSLKLAEVFCTPARVYHSEQFLHAPIYALREGSSTIIIGDDRRSVNAYAVLKEAGVNAYHLKTPQSLEGMLTAIASGVMAIGKLAIDEGRKEPCFMVRKGFLEASTPMIYGGST